MMTDLCAQARDLLPAYSIGATTDEETRFVQLQMVDCPELAHELREYHMLSEGLLRNVPQFAPPPRLLERLMAATPVDSNQHHQPAPAAVLPPLDVPHTVEMRPAALNVVPKRKSHEPRIAWRTVLASGLVAALVLTLVGSNLYWVTQVNQLRDSRRDLYADYVRLEEELYTQNVSFDAMRAPDTRWARMASPTAATDTAPQSDDPYAWVIWSASREEGVLLAQNFPALEPNKTYQLWGHREESDTSLATFQTDEQGQAILHVNAPTWAFERFWITSEPEGGSSSPSGDPFVRVRLN